MSLIDEALKRAREQAKTNAEDRSARKTTDPWEYAPLPDRRRSVPWPAAALVILAAVVAGVLLVRRPGRDGATASPAPSSGGPRKAPRESLDASRKEPPDGGDSRGNSVTPPVFFDPSKPAAAPPAAAGRSAESGAPKVGEIRSGAGMGSSPAPAAGSPAPESRVAAIAPPAFRVSNASGSPPIRSDGGSEAGRPASPSHTGRAPAPEGRTFVGSLVAPGGGRVELGGIVYSDASPAALLNGRVLPVGGVVEGLTIVRIEEGRVELQGDGLTFFLTLR